MSPKIVFPTGGIYIGIKRKGDANTNEILHKALIRRGFSTEVEAKECGGEKVEVWIVDSDFVNMLYPQEKDFILKFVVYIEIDYILQEFRLIDPVVKKAAKYAKIHRKQLKRRKENCMDDAKVIKQQFRDLQSVLETIAFFDRRYILERHQLPIGEAMPEDVHAEVDEWIILLPGPGMVEITINGQSAEVKCVLNRIVVVPVRRGSRHSLRALTEISYMVVKGPEPEQEP